jgi:sugar/nucleoside kinase (ribokinase family)
MASSRSTALLSVRDWCVTDRNRVLCLGEALVDFVSEQPVDRLTDSPSFVARFGGSQANIAIGAARFGAEVAFGGRAGSDPWGCWLREALLREGVDASLFHLASDVETPHAFVAVSREGEPEFSFFGGSPEGCVPSVDELSARVSEGPGILVFGSDTLICDRDRDVVVDLKRLAVSAGWQVLFDPNLRAGRWQEERLMHDVALGAIEGVAVVKANAAEAVALTGCRELAEASVALCSLGAHAALVTAGPGGAILARSDRSPEHVPAATSRVVDTTGAGDAVAGVVAATLARGGELTAAITAVAMEVAGRVIAERGAVAGLPEPAEARRMLDPLLRA